jgi:hypothetical protein
VPVGKVKSDVVGTFDREVAFATHCGSDSLRNRRHAEPVAN